jgi:hypothetical protein
VGIRASFDEPYEFVKFTENATVLSREKGPRPGFQTQSIHFGFGKPRRGVPSSSSEENEAGTVIFRYFGKRIK